MSGLDKIIADIGENAKNQYNTILEEAKLDASKLLAAEQKKAQEECDALLEKAQKQSEAADAMASSSGQLLFRQEVLRAKVKLMDEVIGEAIETILSGDDAAYFDMVTRVIVSNIQSKPGKIRFNSKDLARLPKDFISSLNEKLPQGAVLSLDDACPVDIRGGCVLIYGEIEENLSFDVIAASKKDALRDRASQLLFD